MRRGCWRTLGIDPTTDRATIRRAYAARLKAMDVDADPDGFATLRAARDAALDHAVATDASVAIDVPVETAAPPEPEPAIDPQEAALRAAIEDHFHALETLLFPGHDAPPTPDELAAVEHHGRALLADPRLERVDFAAGAERWFAEHLAASVPRSDPLLEPAAAAFGWIARRGDYALSADALTVVDRIGATRFATLVSDPSHRLHRAWRELQREDDGPRDWRVRRGPVRELLTTIRQQYPAAEHWLNPTRIGKWDERLSTNRGAGRILWIAIILAVAAVRIWIGPGDRPVAQRPVATYLAPDPDRMARDMTGVDMARLAVANPGLADAIRNIVTALNDTSNETAAERRLDALYARRQLAGLATASDDLLRDIAAFEVEVKQGFAGADPVRCGDYAFPMDDARLTGDARERQRALLKRVMLGSDDRTIPGGRFRYTVPGSIMAAVARRTGLAQDRVGDALSGKGDHADVCRVQIALRQAALAGGRRGTEMLRDMQPDAAGD